MAMDVTVQLPNRPGALADLGEALGGAGINIAGATGMAAVAETGIHLLADDPAARGERSNRRGSRFRTNGTCSSRTSRTNPVHWDRPV